MGYIYYKEVLYGKNIRHLRQTCSVGAESVTIQDPNIKTTSIIDHSVITASGFLVQVDKINVTAGQVVLVFPNALDESAVVKIDIKNL